MVASGCRELNTPFAVAFAIIGLVLAVLITASVVSAAVVAELPADRRAQEHRIHPGPGRRRLPGPDRHPGAGRRHRRHDPGQLCGCCPCVNVGPFDAQDHGGRAAMDQRDGPAGHARADRAGGAGTGAGGPGGCPRWRRSRPGRRPRPGTGTPRTGWPPGCRLPRPVTMGLAAPFTRPARSAVTLAAVTFGLTAVVLATGLDSSLAKINGSRQPAFGQTANIGSWPACRPVGQRSRTSQEQAISRRAARPAPDAELRGQGAGHRQRARGRERTCRSPSTAATPPGLGWDITSGTWYTGPGQVGRQHRRSRHGRLAGRPGHPHLTNGRQERRRRITGEAFVPRPLAALTPHRAPC